MHGILRLCARLSGARPSAGRQRDCDAPPQIVLTFTEGVEPLFSTIELRDKQGTALAVGKPHTNPVTNASLLSTFLCCVLDGIV